MAVSGSVDFGHFGGPGLRALVIILRRFFDAMPGHMRGALLQSI